MALVAPHVFVAGTFATVDKFATLTDGITQLQGGTPAAGALDYAIMTQTTGTALTATAAALGFDGTEVIDAAGGHNPSSNPSRYVFKTAGFHRCIATVIIPASATVHSLQAYFQMNGSALSASQFGFVQVSAPNSASEVCAVTITGSTPISVNGTTDYVEVYAISTTNLTTSNSVRGGCRFEVKWEHS